jgi:hypothetical protein
MPGFGSLRPDSLNTSKQSRSCFSAVRNCIFEGLAARHTSWDVRIFDQIAATLIP